MKKKIIIILSLLGVGLFINLIVKIGLRTIWDTVKNISPEYFLILLLIRFVFWYIRTLNWKIIMEKCQITLPFWKIFKARVAGFAV
ncbi:MAG: flippase-like domain-containing protein, partial [Candidatus Aminicenantes bacterium]|nr:flippase-like domain-containing protein [Candidatus Aminicenantes bacterium]